ncbi:uncharacterized protein ACR2FA_002855 [Aphomia sociella]
MQAQYIFIAIFLNKTLAYRTSMCLRNHEEFSLCGWKCPPTCVNLHLLASNKVNCPSNWECRVGCRCSAGFIRDEYTKKCILVVVSVYTFAAVTLMVSAAPTLNEDVITQQPGNAELNSQQPQFVREKRSQYPVYGGGYSAPCGGAAVAALPAVAPIPAVAPAGYQLNMGPVHAGYGYGAPHSYGYGAPHYRSDEFGADQDTFFPDMEHMMSDHVPMARYGGYGGYGPSAAHVGGMSGIAGLGQLAPAAPAGPAFGVFPNANVGGCNVPLLLSCSPSIVPGRLVKSQGYGGGYGAPVAGPVNAYRGVDESHLEHEDQHEEPENHEHLSVANDSHPTNTHQ